MKFKVGDWVEEKRWGRVGIVKTIRDSRVAPYCVHVTSSNFLDETNRLLYFAARDLTPYKEKMDMAGKRIKKIDKRRYKIVKELLDSSKLSASQLAKILPESTATISRIKKYESWEDYCQYKREHADKAYWKRGNRSNGGNDTSTDSDEQSAQEADAPEQPTRLRPDATDILVELHQKNVALQERQAIALEQLVDAWNSSPAKKKLF